MIKTYIIKTQTIICFWLFKKENFNLNRDRDHLQKDWAILGFFKISRQLLSTVSAAKIVSSYDEHRRLLFFSKIALPFDVFAMKLSLLLEFCGFYQENYVSGAKTDDRFHLLLKERNTLADFPHLWLLRC